MKAIKEIYRNTKGLIASIACYYAKPKELMIFTGYYHWRFALRYAKRRNEWWPEKLDQLGKKQGIFKVDRSLLVCNKVEVSLMKKRGFIKSPMSPSRIFKSEDCTKLLEL